MFDQTVAPDGYAWWYVDGISDDGTQGIAIIAFVGSVFSPFYFAARKAKSAVDPEAFCAINVALYPPGGKRWSFSEWPRAEVRRSADEFAIGTNRLHFGGGNLEIAIDDRTAPFKKPVRGRVRISPEVLLDQSFAVDPAGRHRWGPIAPIARIEVAFEEPAWGFAGSGYFDRNWGEAPIEEGILEWTWSRYAADRSTVVFYDAAALDGTGCHLARRFRQNGDSEEIEAPPKRRLPRTRLWAFQRETRGEPPFRPRVMRTFEDSPFYSRSLVESVVCGQRALGVHESLSLDRFKTRWMQFMLPFRMLKRT